MPTLATNIHGLALPNPFLIGSGPPGTNRKVIAKAFDEGWGGVVAKTVSLDASKIVNVSPRYGKLTGRDKREIFGWENIELIATTPLEEWLDDFKFLKDQNPQHVLIASVMEEYRRDAWHEIVERCQAAGVDALELNLSCPHGLPERRMGSAMGEDPGLLAEVAGWVMEVARVPVWAKLTPNVGRIEEPARAALQAGLAGVSLINTIRSVIGVDLKTLRPMPTVEGWSTVGGYSSVAVRPIALRMVMEVAQLIEQEFAGKASVSGIGGIESGEDAAQFILLGASTVQVCTGVMKHGYRLIEPMRESLLAFMAEHQFETLDDFRGRALPYFTTHADLVARQAAAKQQRSAATADASAATDPPAVEKVEDDAQWNADTFVEQSAGLVNDEGKA